jgi:hypothetical protein
MGRHKRQRARAHDRRRPHLAQLRVSALEGPSGAPGTFGPFVVLSATSAAIAFDYPTGHDRTQIMIGRVISSANRSSFIKLPPGLR